MSKHKNNRRQYNVRLGMNISKLYQRAHALRMADKTCVVEQTPLAEFYVGQALSECCADLNTGIMQIGFTARILRRYARKPEALRKALLCSIIWPRDWHLAWERLLGTYGTKPRLLLAIADGMEA